MAATFASDTDRDASKRKHDAWLYPDPSKPCKCESDWVSFGRLDGINMGYGWARVTTHPYCFHHGDKASAHFKKHKNWNTKERCSDCFVMPCVCNGQG